MYKTTVTIDGMMCGMCESHINNAIRNKITVKKISSSHKKGETVIISESKCQRANIPTSVLFCFLSFLR